MFKVNTIIKIALVLTTVLVLCTSQDTATRAPWSFMPVARPEKTGDPVSRVFDGRLYVYTSLDHVLECGPKSSKPPMREGSGKFCNNGYRAFSTSDSSLQTQWTSHGNILNEEDVPRAF